ncbi:hypothetical protein B0H13DRAFT_2331224 [Mycena leptocephala]|nr:hypothetical protein B0H13DRAFT_2331224 [Mycena leptocephala]
MFGRRPLSALGMVHLFQRRRPVRTWLEDFPTIHTEGGLPGSDSAGIIAFIRERLVNLGDTPGTTDVAEADIEAQMLKVEAAAEADETLRVARWFEITSVCRLVPSLGSKPGPLSLGYIL